WVALYRGDDPRRVFDLDVGAVLAELEAAAPVGEDLQGTAEEPCDGAVRDRLALAVPAAVPAEADLPGRDRGEAGARPSVAPRRVEHERHRAVVHERERHPRAEAPRGDVTSGAACPGHERLVERLGARRRRGVGEGGTSALAAVAVERELRHDQQIAPDVL